MTPGKHPLGMGMPERWAVEWGEDRHGVFTGFAVGEVVQRMRWVPPGHFIMGSPESEAGRYDDEVQHEVQITKGFWLGDTPVTQELWQAVMGENPSEFVSPDRPVEQVSWGDCQEFIARLNDMVPGLRARLPSEAQWEYACRAGMETATWAGELEILGRNNAPLLDAIAWYGGNCGKDFELETGWDTTGEHWDEKQYDFKKGGTHPVRRKQPNPLGLYDMLGNVWEWCEDWYGPYGSAPAIDPTGPKTGSRRVIRGGSWVNDARNVRAAHRYAHSPALRYGGLGFRLSRGQILGGAAEPRVRSPLDAERP